MNIACIFKNKTIQNIITNKDWGPNPSTIRLTTMLFETNVSDYSMNTHYGINCKTIQKYNFPISLSLLVVD